MSILARDSFSAVSLSFLIFDLKRNMASVLVEISGRKIKWHTACNLCAFFIRLVA